MASGLLQANRHQPPAVGCGLELPLVREIQSLCDQPAKSDRHSLHLRAVCLRKFQQGIDIAPLEEVNRAPGLCKGS
ncbi:MAG: hypothetical protein JO069_15400 [Verrucomicrobia bacterium]|nr:hypothetical protein [Verrucomicrobiota bacterium]